MASSSGNSSYKWWESMFSDLVIVAGGKRFHVHKSVIERNKMLKWVIEKEAVFGCTEIHFNDISADVMKQILTFLYTNKVSVRQDSDILSNLLSTAHKFGITDLVKHCTNLMVKNLNPRNAVFTYNFAITYDLDLLQTLTLDYILDCDIITCERKEFQQMIEESPILGFFFVPQIQP